MNDTSSARKVRERRHACRPMGPYPLERDQRSIRIPVRNDQQWAWARIDSADLARVLAHRWRLVRGYAVTTVWNAKGKQGTHIMLHRMITNAPAALLVDHRWHDTLDCRRRALRFATHSQNSSNARRFTRHSSKYRGVTKNGNRWQAQIRHRGHNHYLGLYATEVEAAGAYNRAAKRLHGAFAILNRIRLRPSSTADTSGARAA